MANRDNQPRILEFVEAPAFSRYRDDYLTDEEFLALQLALAANPEEGDLDSGSWWGAKAALEGYAPEEGQAWRPTGYLLRFSYG